MGYTHTHYYETIIQRQIRAGRASNKSEVIHQALALLDAVTQGQGSAGARFRNADELEALLLQAPGRGHDCRAQGAHLRAFEAMNWQAPPETGEDLIAARDFIAADNTL